MSDRIIQNIEIYTPTTRFCGNIAVPARLRISDFLNDNTRYYLKLSRAKMSSGRDLLSGLDVLLDDVAVNKSNVVAIVLRADASQAGENSANRVTRVPERVVIYAPPLVLTGDTHHPSDVDVIDAISCTPIDFIPLTNAAVWWYDSQAPIGEGVEFAAVNRRWMTAVHPLLQTETVLLSPSLISQALRV